MKEIIVKSQRLLTFWHETYSLYPTVPGSWPNGPCQSQGLPLCTHQIVPRFTRPLIEFSCALNFTQDHRAAVGQDTEILRYSDATRGWDGMGDGRWEISENGFLVVGHCDVPCHCHCPWSCRWWWWWWSRLVWAKSNAAARTEQNFSRTLCCL